MTSELTRLRSSSASRKRDAERKQLTSDDTVGLTCNRQYFLWWMASVPFWKARMMSGVCKFADKLSATITFVER
jgi:hypothetical protein